MEDRRHEAAKPIMHQERRQFPATEDLAKCILMIESTRDLEDYLSTVVDITNPQHLKFVKELIHKKQLHNQGYKKSELDNYMKVQGQEKKEKKKGQKSKNEKKPNTNSETNEVEKTNSKKKPHYVNMFSDEANRTVLLTGRHICECQATKHELIGNCLSCGRIVCQQEGAGPCLFCNTMVQARGAPQTSAAQTDSSLESALELRDRLLEYDKSSERRTKVIDDENDYFSTNSVWLSKEQKEALKRKQEELQALKHSRARNILIDFTGRCVLDDTFRKLNEENSILDDVTDIMENMDLKGPLSNDNVDPNSTLEMEPVYDPSFFSDKSATGSKWHNSVGKVQDKQVMEMSDNGVCLSMHQPWATLLVSGIKRHEGRSWYTAHRGRIWIAAAAKQPTPEEIEAVKNQYRLIRGEDTKFPSKYPVGCLLGCVNLVDCLAQEEYREHYPEGESDSPFVFICEDPTPCPVLFPMKGKHKIYKMESKIHQAAAKCIQRLAKK
ncbi:hypothetical protein GE061_012302 [Apolygus lucorum]|uniref:ASCH domain-containing protein n=1 Tax=Apolygus lucorum TaxID=248454 RepID=A0A8S9XS80_APOLU|nr:hypothetical protein GE061_012302 [Apolygus lucorum]